MLCTVVTMRQIASADGDMAKRLDELEEETEALVMNHETFSRNTRSRLKHVFDALSDHMPPPDPPKRPIGFINSEDKDSKKASKSARSKA